MGEVFYGLEKVLKETSSGEGKSRVIDYFDQVLRVATHKNPKFQDQHSPTVHKFWYGEFVWGRCFMGQKVLKATSFGEGKSRVTVYFYQVFRVAPQKKNQKFQEQHSPTLHKF